MVRAIK